VKRWLLVSAAVLASVAGVIAAALTVAALLWNSVTARKVARLHKPFDAKASRFSRDDLAGLPDPVVRYFEFALTPGQPLVRNARFEQVGDFAMRANCWSPFTAVEYFSVEPRGFLWDARIRLAAMIPLYVRDGYFAGEGAMYGTVAAIAPVVNQRGTSQMASGELLRYLAELVLLPTALLPSGGISWKPLDHNTARVTLTDGPTTVSCDVAFSERGEIVRVSAMRNFADRKLELTPWVGRFSDYRRVNGMMVPMSSEVEWVLPEGPFSYWRGQIQNVHYEPFITN
jgi:hypothetical protein